MATETKQVLNLAIAAGEILLRNGSEVFRVQDTMQYIAKAYHEDHFHSYVLTNGLFASIDSDGEQYSGMVRSVPENSVHLGRIAAVNDLSRRIEREHIPIADAFDILRKIETISYETSLMRIAMCAVGSACFAYLFGGTAVDAVLAFLCGAVLQQAVHYLDNHKIVKIVRNILLSALMALCGFCGVQLMAFFGVSATIDYVIIGCITPLVPGIALTNSIRDFTMGDYLSGAIRMLDALLVAAAIALGVGTVLKVLSFFVGGAL